MPLQKKFTATAQKLPGSPILTGQRTRTSILIWTAYSCKSDLFQIRNGLTTPSRKLEWVKSSSIKKVRQTFLEFSLQVTVPTAHLNKSSFPWALVQQQH